MCTASDLVYISKLEIILIKLSNVYSSENREKTSFYSLNYLEVSIHNDLYFSDLFLKIYLLRKNINGCNYVRLPIVLIIALLSFWL